MDKVNDAEERASFLVMYKARELYVEGASQGTLRQKVMYETMSKEFMGRKVKTTPGIALTFIQRCMNKKPKINFHDE